MKKFEIIASNPSNEGKSFVTTLRSETIVATPFGDKKKRETYYVSAPNKMEVGSHVELELKEWNVVERPYNPTGSEEFMCKWLHVGDQKISGKVITQKEAIA